MNKILIAEDDEGLSYVLKESLSAENVQVLLANTGDHAWEIIKANPDLSLIASDIIMPGITGLEIRKRILLDENLTRIPFLFLTGRLEHLGPAQSLRPQLILAKPILGDDFRQIVTNILFK